MVYSDCQIEHLQVSVASIDISFCPEKHITHTHEYRICENRKEAITHHAIIFTITSTHEIRIEIQIDPFVWYTLCRVDAWRWHRGVI